VSIRSKIPFQNWGYYGLNNNVAKYRDFENKWYCLWGGNISVIVFQENRQIFAEK
jgi:hypothetical protein